VFGIDTPIGEARCEPLLSPHPASTPPPDRASIARDAAARRREPARPNASPASPPPASPPPDRAPPVGSRRQTRPFGPLFSALLHLLPLLLLLNWPWPPPAAVTPIPVQLVFQPPPPAKPRPPQPRPKPALRPPLGRLASDDIGDTRTRGEDTVRSEATAAEKPASETAPPEPEQQMAAVIPPAPVPEAADLLHENLVRQPPRPKTKPPVPQPLLRRAAARIHLAPRPPQFPGPAATRDEYLAYLKYLTIKHLNMLSLAMVAGRRGQTMIDILVLDDGTVATLKVARTSGYPDIDRQVEAMLHAVGRFPPLPQWFQGPSMHLEFTIKFPEALED
jgi:periplasmic protein TonB